MKTIKERCEDFTLSVRARLGMFDMFVRDGVTEPERFLRELEGLLASVAEEVRFLTKELGSKRKRGRKPLASYKKQMIRLRRSMGKSVAEIADEYDVSRQTVYRVLAEGKASL